MRVSNPEDDWLKERVCPDCDIELIPYGRYLACDECGRQWKRVVVEEQYRPL